jgi:hypothetical protein
MDATSRPSSPMTRWAKKVLLDPGEDSLWAAIIISDSGEPPSLPPVED